MGRAYKLSCCSRTEACGFNQTYLIATSRKFTALIALNDNTATGLDANHPCSNPAKGC